MILRKIVLDNFRQFEDHNEVVFAAGAHNTTVILGDNGRGKTSLYRALMFCLFGDRTLTQDQDVDISELTLVNLNKLNLAEPRQPVRAVVQLEVTHHNNRYVIERTLSAVRDEAAGVVEQVNPAKIYCTDAAGNTTIIEEPVAIDGVVRDILDPRLKEYFLFDGERINRLTLASASQRMEVKEGVRRLLNIDSLEQAIRLLGATNRRLLAEMDEEASGELGKVLQQLAQCDDDQRKLDDKEKEAERELANAEDERRALRKSLSVIAEIKPYIDERNKLEATERDLTVRAEDSLTRMSHLIGHAPLPLIKEPLERAFHIVNRKKSSGQIPASIRMELIDRLINEQQCICRRHLLQGTPEFSAVLEWKDRAVGEEIEDNVLELWRRVSSVVDRVDNIRDQFHGEVQGYNTIVHDLEIVQRRLDEVSARIGKEERQDAGKLEASYQVVEEKMLTLGAGKQLFGQQLADLSDSRERLNAQREDLSRREEQKNELSARAALVRATQESLKKILQGFGEQVREQLGALSSRTMASFLDAGGRDTLRGVVIQDDYSLQILDRWNKPFLANISAGQRQLMSMAFICSLLQAAAKDGVLEMPLFMDTPFGRLSSRHRYNLIKEIPRLASQWVLLATDTELGRKEANALLAGGRWGECYVLRGGHHGSTTIERVPAKDSFAFLQDLQENIDEDVD